MNKEYSKYTKEDVKMNVVLKEVRKLFTKEKKSNIMRINYNPLKVNYNLICEREGVNMEEEVIVKELSKKYNKKEALISEMIKKCKALGYDIKEAEKLIREFMEIDKCY